MSIKNDKGEKAKEETPRDNVLGTNEAIDGVVVHCSATPNNKPVKAIDIHRGHIVDRDFDGIGYHEIIHLDGGIEAGRPHYWTGAHVRGFNQGKIAIMLVGTDEFTPEQLNALETRLRSLKKEYGLSRLQVKGHRDLSPDKDGDGVVEESEWLKTCPGINISKFMKTRAI